MNNKRIHIIVPVDGRDVLNTYLEVQGWGPDNIIVPLAESGVITHYGGSGSYNDMEQAVLSNPDFGAENPTAILIDGDNLDFDSAISFYDLSRILSQEEL